MGVHTRLLHSMRYLALGHSSQRRVQDTNFDMFTISKFALLAFVGCFGSSVADPFNATTLNLAHPYSTDFHVASALIFVTTIIIVLSVFGISLAMWNMDPGRDSIIYRMTSQRMKKEQ